jgi:uncharacterized repeat protein (TIGR03803 family)
VYQVNVGMPSPTFFAFVPMRTLAQNDDLLNLRDLLHEAEGEAAERMQQIARAAYAQTESNLYAISPEKSHVSKEFAAGDPEFWTPKPLAPMRVATVMLIVTLVLASRAAAASNYKILYVFNNASVGPSNFGLILDAAGNLYGTTRVGGANSDGAVFKLTPNPHANPAGCCWTESVLYSGADGQYPQGGVIFDAAGNLYGTTEVGGAYGRGVVFKLTSNPDGTWTEGVLHSFTGAHGSEPYAGLIFDAAGNLYGTTFYSGDLAKVARR